MQEGTIGPSQRLESMQGPPQLTRADCGSSDRVRYVGCEPEATRPLEPEPRGRLGTSRYRDGPGRGAQSHGPAATVTTRGAPDEFTERGHTAERIEARVGAPRRPAVDVTLWRAVRTGGRGARRAKPR